MALLDPVDRHLQGVLGDPDRAGGVGDRELGRLAAGVHPFDTVEWEIRSAAIKGENGEVLFEQNNCEIPAGWTQLATNVVVSKYFYGDTGGGSDPAKGGRECRAKKSNIGGQSTHSAPGSSEVSHQCPAPDCSCQAKSRWSSPTGLV